MKNTVIIIIVFSFFVSLATTTYIVIDSGFLDSLLRTVPEDVGVSEQVNSNEFSSEPDDQSVSGEILFTNAEEAFVNISCNNIATYVSSSSDEFSSSIFKNADLSESELTEEAYTGEATIMSCKFNINNEDGTIAVRFDGTKDQLGNMYRVDSQILNLVTMGSILESDDIGSSGYEYHFGTSKNSDACRSHTFLDDEDINYMVIEYTPPQVSEIDCTELQTDMTVLTEQVITYTEDNVIALVQN